MSAEDRQWQDLFQEMLESSGKNARGDDTRNEAGDELDEMLFLAQQLQGLGRSKMPDSEAALARARERVLQSIPAPARAPAQPPFWRRWTPPTFSWAPTALIAALAIALIFGLALFASGGARPGGPLYPVKQVASEIMRLLTPSEQPEKEHDQVVAYVSQTPSPPPTLASTANPTDISPVSKTPTLERPQPTKIASATKPASTKSAGDDNESTETPKHPPEKTPTPTATQRKSTVAPGLTPASPTATQKPTIARTVIPTTPAPAATAIASSTPTSSPVIATGSSDGTPTITSTVTATPTVEPTATPSPTPTRVKPTSPPVRPSGNGPGTTPHRAQNTPQPTTTPVRTKTISGVIRRVIKARGKVIGFHVRGKYIRVTKDTVVKGKIVNGKKATVTYYAKKTRKKRQLYAVIVVVKNAATPTPQYKKTSGVVSKVKRSKGKVVSLKIDEITIFLTGKTAIRGKIVEGKKATAIYYTKKKRHYAVKIVMKGAVKTPAAKKTPTPKPRKIVRPTRVKALTPRPTKAPVHRSTPKPSE